MKNKKSDDKKVFLETKYIISAIIKNSRLETCELMI